MERSLLYMNACSMKPMMENAVRTTVDTVAMSSFFMTARTALLWLRVATKDTFTSNAIDRTVPRTPGMPMLNHMERLSINRFSLSTVASCSLVTTGASQLVVLPTFIYSSGL